MWQAPQCASTLSNCTVVQSNSVEQSHSSEMPRLHRPLQCAYHQGFTSRRTPAHTHTHTQTQTQAQIGTKVEIETNKEIKTETETETKTKTKTKIETETERERERERERGSLSLSLSLSLLHAFVATSLSPQPLASISHSRTHSIGSWLQGLRCI